MFHILLWELLINSNNMFNFAYKCGECHEINDRDYSVYDEVMHDILIWLH